MNKNFIRAVKREYTKAFYEFLKNKDLKDSKRALVNNTQQFVCHLLENTSVKWSEIDDFDLKRFSKYLMALTNYCKFKSLHLNKEEKLIKEEVYNLLYYFSQIKFYSFVKVSEIRVLILILKERLGMKGLLSSITSSNYSSYRVHINNLMNLFKDK